MADTLAPDTPEGVLDAVRWAAAEAVPLEVLGHGSKRGVGRPVQAEWSLDLSGLSGVTLYEPEELVLSARAGTPVVEIETLLAGRDQELAFEPMDFGPVFGTAPGRGTLGGLFAANVSGPRRIKAGAARDHVLGIQAVSGRGEAFKSGGRVVKNVTGYDLSRGLAGSWGTLAAATELTFKVLPRAETAATLAVLGLSDDAAVAVLCEAMGSPWDISGAAHLPANVTDGMGSLDGSSATLMRLEGFAPSVTYRLGKLRDGIAGRDVTVIEGAESAGLWRAIRDVLPFAGGGRPLWRISVAPTAAPGFVQAVGQVATARWFYDWSGGLVWLEVGDDAGDALAGTIRAAVHAAGGGHATLVRGDPALRTSVPPFEPQDPALAALARRLKEQFDPRGILNPGRMVA